MNEPTDILDIFTDAYDHPERVAERRRAAGGRVAHVLGVDAPREMLIAAGVLPVRLVDRGGPTPRADRALGAYGVARRSRSLLEQMLSAPAEDIVVISHADAEGPQLYSVLRELASLGDAGPWPVHFVDLVHLPRSSSKRYNIRRLQQFREQLRATLGCALDDGALRRAIAAANEQRRWLARAAALRCAEEARLSGEQTLKIIGAAAVLPIDEHIDLLRGLVSSARELPVRAGRRILVTGSTHERANVYALIESCGGLVVAEDQDWGDPWYADALAEAGDPVVQLADPAVRTPIVSRSLRSRGGALSAAVARSRPESVVHVSFGGDEAAPWEAVETRRFCSSVGLPLLELHIPDAGELSYVREIVREFIIGPRTERRSAPQESLAPEPASSPRGTRSRKSLRSLERFGAYQREWFAGVRRRAASGEPLAVVNANAPQEILRALDIPFVVNQWWAAIVAAKQQSPRYLRLLRGRGYPTQIDAYSSQGLAALFDDDAKAAPWGGLPRPSFVQAVTGTDGTAKLFEAWAQEARAELFLYERTIDARWSLFSEWWRDLPDRWDEMLEPERLDLMVEELQAAIRSLERSTGRTFSHDRFADVMALVNEQEEYFHRTRDLIARTRPAPVSVVDTMPATMAPQWQRGTEWGRDAARAFYEEVAQRAACGEAACPHERIRLMWVGRGMWSEMGFYQRWEASHGAVFVWSMYLALAADGYIRTFDRGRDPLRALAGRIITMGDELRMPTWAAAWHVHEAQTHGVHGAVALSDADPFVLRALERAGVPVLALPLDNFNQEGVDRAAIDDQVTRFIEALPPGDRG